MAKTSFLLTVGVLLGRSVALSHNASTEQYCFSRADSPLSDNTTWPSITILYSGLTLTTIPVTATLNELFTPVPPAMLGSTDRNMGPTYTSGLYTAIPSPSQDQGWTSGNASSRSSASERDLSISSTLTSASSQSTMITGPDPGLVSNSSGSSITNIRSPLITSSTSNFVTTPSMAVSGSNTTDAGINVPSILPPAQAGVGPNSNVSDSSRTTPSDGRFSTATAGGATSSLSDPASTTSGGFASDIEKTPSSVSPGLSAPTGLNTISSFENATLTLSPSAIDALQLAQFVKNFAVSILNTSMPYTRRSTENDNRASLVSALVADISEVSLSSCYTCSCQLTHAITTARADATKGAKRASSSVRRHRRATLPIHNSHQRHRASFTTRLFKGC